MRFYDELNYPHPYTILVFWLLRTLESAASFGSFVFGSEIYRATVRAHSSLNFDFFSKNTTQVRGLLEPSALTLFKSNYLTGLTLEQLFTYTNEEHSDAPRSQRFFNPVYRYDYKSGDYFPKFYKEFYTQLFTTVMDITNAARVAP